MEEHFEYVLNESCSRIFSISNKKYHFHYLSSLVTISTTSLQHFSPSSFYFKEPLLVFRQTHVRGWREEPSFFFPAYSLCLLLFAAHHFASQFSDTCPQSPSLFFPPLIFTLSCRTYLISIWLLIYLQCRGLDEAGIGSEIGEAMGLFLSDLGHNKVGSQWVDVAGLWTPVPTHDLHSDKSERKLLANGSSSADYVEVETEPHLNDAQPQNKLGETLLMLLLMLLLVLN